MFFSFFTFLSVSRHISRSIVCAFHFSKFFCVLAIFQVLKWAFLIFHIFQCFSPFSRSYNVCVSFCMFIHVTCNIPGPIVCVFHFLWFSVFSPYPRSTVWLYLFSGFSGFPDIFHILQCVFLIFPWFSVFSPYSWSYSVHFLFSTFLSVFHPTPGPTMFMSHFHVFSVFFFCHNPGPRVCFSPFPTFSVFHTIFHILQCVFLIFQNCQFLAIIQVLQCAFLIFHLFQCFSP